MQSPPKHFLLFLKNVNLDSTMAPLNNKSKPIKNGSINSLI